MMWNHLEDETYYDAARFDLVFAMAQKFHVPLHLHPAAPAADSAFELFVGNYPAAVAGESG